MLTTVDWPINIVQRNLPVAVVGLVMGCLVAAEEVVWNVVAL